MLGTAAEGDVEGYVEGRGGIENCDASASSSAIEGWIE